MLTTFRNSFFPSSHSNDILSRIWVVEYIMETWCSISTYSKSWERESRLISTYPFNVKISQFHSETSHRVTFELFIYSFDSPNLRQVDHSIWLWFHVLPTDCVDSFFHQSDISCSFVINTHCKKFRYKGMRKVFISVQIAIIVLTSYFLLYIHNFSIKLHRWHFYNIQNMLSNWTWFSRTPILSC